MTDLIYQNNSYIKTFSANVTRVDEDGHIALDRSVFYPGGGGQPCDCGTLDSSETRWYVPDVKKQGATLWHALQGAAAPEIGQPVNGTLDWVRRYQLMRTHTAMHILCGVVWRDYGASVTGGNMQPLRGRMDFEFETMRAELVHDIEQKINAEVASAREVRVNIMPRSEAFEIPDLIRTKINLLPEGISEVRTVEIVGLDLQADGGTHVANLDEVGAIRLVDYKSKGKINKRIILEIDE
jgi:misacylated tRNA(Ala) deacylase